jgi:AraC-like DNA-binding protein
MLSSGDALSRIALDCGMCDQAHFTRVFRRVVGVSPSVWRRQFPRLDSGGVRQNR